MVIMEQKISVESPQPSLPPQMVQLVTFQLENNYFGINTDCIFEIVPFAELTPVPGAEDLIEGMIDLRGDIIPVLDVRKRLKLIPRSDSGNSKILIAEIQGYVFGFIVDRAENVCEFSITDFAPPPFGGNHPGGEFTVGVTHHKERLLIYLDVDQFLDIKQMLLEN